MGELIRFTASILIVLLFLIVPYLWIKNRREVALHIFFSSLTAWIISQTIKFLFYTPRPYVNTDLETYVFHAPTDGAFPSSHTAASFALAMCLFLHNKPAGLVAFVAALAIGTARVLANVHWPRDIVGGAVLGIIVALTTIHFHGIISRRLFMSSKVDHK